MDCMWVNLKNVGPTFFSNSRYVILYMYQNVINTAEKSNFLSCYVAIILQKKDSWSANLTFRVQN